MGELPRLRGARTDAGTAKCDMANLPDGSKNDVAGVKARCGDVPVVVIQTKARSGADPSGFRTTHKRKHEQKQARRPAAEAEGSRKP